MLEAHDQGLSLSSPDEESLLGLWMPMTQCDGEIYAFIFVRQLILAKWKPATTLTHPSPPPYSLIPKWNHTKANLWISIWVYSQYSQWMNREQVQFGSEAPLCALQSSSVLMCLLSQNAQIFYLPIIMVKDHRMVRKVYIFSERTITSTHILEFSLRDTVNFNRLRNLM